MIRMAWVSDTEIEVDLDVIGRMVKGQARVLKVDRKGGKELRSLPRDEILKVYSFFYSMTPERGTNSIPISFIFGIISLRHLIVEG